MGSIPIFDIIFALLFAHSLVLVLDFLSCNYWFTNVYCYYTFLSIRHKSLCPRHELDVTKMVVINLGCWLWLIVFSDVPTMFW